MKVYFHTLAIGQAFTCNGNPYIKKSSRTAWTGEGHPSISRKWFYFGQMEIVEVKNA